MTEKVSVVEPGYLSPAARELQSFEEGQIFPSGETPPLRTGLTIDDIAHPAYMVNYNFELTWFNEHARRTVLGFDAPPPGTESRNIFGFLPVATDDISAQRRSELTRLFVSLGKMRLAKPCLLGLVKHLELDEIDFIGALYEKSSHVMNKMVVDIPCALLAQSGISEAWRVYGIYFREGILVIHVPADKVDPDLLEFISRRDIVVRNLLRKQLPVYTPLAVLVTDLKNSLQIRSDLPPDEYFELVDEIWTTMAPIFRKYSGTYGNHVGDGIRYFFLPQPDSNYISNAEACAQELKQEMEKFGERWQLRTGRNDVLELNVWLHEGQEWLGALQAASNVKSAIRCSGISPISDVNNFARSDALRAIKNLGNKLMAKQGVRHGAESRYTAPAAGGISTRDRATDSRHVDYVSPGVVRTGAPADPYRLWELAKCA
jgi:hypothetical protein